MKLIIAIIQDEDASEVISHLNEAKFQVTRLSTKGGFLRAGNTTIMTGVEDEKVEGALKIIEENSKARTQYATLPSSCGAMHGLILAPIEVKVAVQRYLYWMWRSSTNIDSGKIQGKERRICIHLRKSEGIPLWWSSLGVLPRAEEAPMPIFSWAAQGQASG